ncbi:hypothetical protein HNY73_008589 [Argiope bruennichi]|uniref:MSP domain-containing protein n=1 Tax=Argiope bruennichi TaxID=94029 RepID=A0A8T0FDE9_ARGBR|nr:hypothetical protein HNY73_008589 [Argiope bruennichi]
MSPAYHRHHLNSAKKSGYNSQSGSSEEKDNILNEMKEKRSNESLTLTVKPEQFRLPFVSKVMATAVLENNNDSAVCFIVGTNSPESLEIDPRAGCISPRGEAFITVRRPKKVVVTHKNENLIFKIKYCIFCNSTENHKLHSDHYHAMHEENTFEGHTGENCGFMHPKRESSYLKHSKKRHLKPDESDEAISKNEIFFKPSSKRGVSATHPKVPQHNEITLKFESPNDFKLLNAENFKTRSCRKGENGGNSSGDEEAIKETATCRCNHCSMPATKRKYEKKIFQNQCSDCDHLSNNYCCRTADNGLSVGIKCSNKNKCQHLEHCIREKSGNVCCGCVHNYCKCCNCCCCKISCNCKGNTCLQGNWSYNKDFKDDNYIDSKMRKYMRLKLQNKELSEEGIRGGKQFKKIPKHHKINCKCSVEILVNRPKVLPSTFTKEHLIFKIKYCSHKNSANPNTKYSTLHRRPQEQVYIINNKITNEDICSKQTYCYSNMYKRSNIQNRLQHRLRILGSQTSSNSLSTDKTKFGNTTKIQRKSRHPFTIYQPFTNERLTIQNEIVRRTMRECYRRVSPLKHTAGDDKNVSAIKKYIEKAKIKNSLLKHNNICKESGDDSINLNCYPASDEKMLQEMVNHQQFDETNTECNFNCTCQFHDAEANDNCHYHDCNDCSPLLQDHYLDNEHFSSTESSDESSFRNEYCYKNEDSKVNDRKRKKTPTRDVTKMAQESASKFICFSALIFLFLFGIIIFHLWE